MSRIEKINELIRQELGKIILETIDFDGGAMVTILDVDTSDNMETANIWISIFPENKTGSSLDTLNKEIGNIQKALNRRTSMRFTPRITFKLDKSERYADQIGEVFKKIEGD